MVAIQRCLYHFFSCPLKGPFGTGWSTPSFGQCPIDADWHSEDEFMTVSIHRYRDQYWRLHRDQYRLSYQYRHQFIQCRRCFETGLFVYVRPFRAWNYVDLHLIVSLGMNQLLELSESGLRQDECLRGRPRLVLLELQDGARGMVMFVLVVSSSLILLLLLFLPPNQQFWGHILLCLRGVSQILYDTPRRRSSNDVDFDVWAAKSCLTESHLLKSKASSVHTYSDLMAPLCITCTRPARSPHGPDGFSSGRHVPYQSSTGITVPLPGVQI